MMSIDIPPFKDIPVPIRLVHYPKFVELLSKMSFLVKHNYLSEEEVLYLLTLIYGTRWICPDTLDYLETVLRFGRRTRILKLERDLFAKQVGDYLPGAISVWEADRKFKEKLSKCRELYEGLLVFLQRRQS